MWICENCGKTYHDEDIVDEFEYGCECGGQLVEAKKCEKCTNYTHHLRKLCMECVLEEKNIDTMLEIGEKLPEKISINSFLAFCFEPKEINRILTEHLKNCDDEFLQKNIQEFYEMDEFDFMRFVEEKWKKEK